MAVKNLVTSFAALTGEPSDNAALASELGGAIPQVATTSTTFGQALDADSLVLLKDGPDTIYRLTESATPSDSLDTTTHEAVSLDIAGEATTSANLETAYPAASNGSRYGFVIGVTAENGLWQSNGSIWVKQLDNSGDRQTLWDYAEAPVTYSGTNSFLGETASDAEITDGSDATGAANIATFDNGQNESIGPLAGGPINIRKITLILDNYQGDYARGFYIEARNGSDSWTELDITSTDDEPSTRGTFAIVLSGGRFTATGSYTTGHRVDLFFEHATAYDQYRIVSTVFRIHLAEMKGYAANPFGASIDCVNSVNLTRAGNQAINATALTADTLLDDTDGVVLLDPSGADFTMTLPAVATVLKGKKYTFKLITAPATTAVTLDGDGSETIDGAATNATALTAQWDTVTIMSDGTQWLIV